MAVGAVTGAALALAARMRDREQECGCVRQRAVMAGWQIGVGDIVRSRTAAEGCLATALTQ